MFQAIQMKSIRLVEHANIVYCKLHCKMVCLQANNGEREILIVGLHSISVPILHSWKVC